MRNLRKNGKAAQGAYHSGEDRAYLDVGMLETPRLARRLLIHEAIGHRLENLLPGYATAMTQSQHYNHFQLMLKGYFNSDELEHERKAHGWAGYFEEVLQYGAIGYLHD
jgi:hypothetical protein